MPDNADDIWISQSLSPIFRIQFIDSVTIENLIFEYSIEDFVDYWAVNYCLVNNCTFRHGGKKWVYLAGIKDNNITKNVIYDTGAQSATLMCGNISQLVRGECYMEHNYANTSSQIQFTFIPAFYIQGCGNYMKHNLVENVPHLGYLYHGPEIEISYNEAINICNSASDCGALYTGAHLEYRGGSIKYNFFHDSKGFGQPGGGSFVLGIYIDDNMSGQEIFGNIVANFVGNGIHHGGGRENNIYNNIFYNCTFGYYGDARGPYRYHYEKGATYNLLENMDNNGVDRYNPPWSTKYPSLSRLPRTNEELKKPENQHWILPEECDIWCNVMYASTNKDAGYQDGVEKIIRRWEWNTNSSQDPMFYDASNLDFRMRENGEIYKYNCWKEIPVEYIGIDKKDGCKNVLKNLLIIAVVLFSIF
ncbi:hypothetical protein EIN_508750 [Entamoeba invadens IP1]|uniref:Right handed beta helix domain-containing protein n=1 Tax=Entamoeba invadens IP1 TaxID=370355 RepID=A0A0A1UGN6_ENTIV|nr:hypothetical protein EIN_508750 [Entamoeba invadens IP1]ELP92874.1 hypothetical protein EIN_508750 [Entamoeba invadens IP1]|eukprot:XP_004259645.1 hypothetical protein EIN_508750 [Entamoeba invadens IP1]